MEHYLLAYDCKIEKMVPSQNTKIMKKECHICREELRGRKDSRPSTTIYWCIIPKIPCTIDCYAKHSKSYITKLHLKQTKLNKK